MIHSLNVVAAVFFGVKPEEGEKSNPCVWYSDTEIHGIIRA
jgi:hypothetical protein